MEKEVVKLYMITLYFFILIWSIVPIIPRYVMVLGGDPISIGMVMSAAPIATVVTRVVFSMFSEVYSRVFMMRLGMLILGTSYLLLYISSDINTVLIGRLVQGLSLAAFIPPSIAYVVDLAKHGFLGKTLGTRALMASLGYTLGPLLGGIISELIGYKSLFLISSIMAFSAIPLIRLNECRANSKTFSELIKGLVNIVICRNFIILFIVTALQTTILASVIPFLSSYLKLMGYSDYDAGLISSAYGLAGLFSRLFMNLFSDRDVLMLTFLGLSTDLTGLLILSFKPLPPEAFIPILLIGFGDGLFVPCAQTLVFMSSKTELRTVLSGIYATAWDLGMFVGPLITGYLITITNDYLVTFRYLMIFTLLPTVILYLKRRELTYRGLGFGGSS
ncbi:MAG: MFS transporter [Sulfolobales archaeon]